MSANGCKTRYEAVYEREAAHILFSCPEKRNALNRKMWQELSEALEKAREDPRIKIIVLRGERRAFSAGDDISEMYTLNTFEEAYEYFQAHKKAFLNLITMPKQVLAVVEGPAVGGGAELLLAADVVIASRKSIIGYPEGLLGLIAPVLTTLGVHVLGYRRARALAVTGVLLGPEEAMRLGVVSLVADPGKVWDLACEVADMMRAIPEESTLTMKRLALESLPDIEKALEQALTELARLAVTPTAKERMRLFLEGKLRPPQAGV